MHLQSLHDVDKPSVPGGQKSDDGSELQQDALAAENARMKKREREIMDLLGTTSPDRIIHDLRNVLNERQLLRALCDVS